MNIGFQIKYLRLKKQLTQKELAERVKVTSGYISQIENNLISPSLKVLFSLLQIFKISISDFFKQVNNIELISQKKDFSSISNKELKHITYFLFPQVLKYNMEPMIIEIEPYGQTTIERPNVSDVFCLVLEGEVNLFLNQYQFFVKEGETFYLSTNKEYYLSNHNNKKMVKILKVISPSSVD
ncbi:helix-turn-helix domain-containing protein [Candidatus Phytoplasma pini]|uniref:Transcriptional regulator n=1 Tax=Candidatus Phytoplasma pini TaxID=267362 RepID=A0A559KJV6_9MOLU|nr:helix-turn-helix transcriptional regulator [Candidatus Phytoplasma pini]TVY12411.1 Transcriptional regulator [Candidatus Phytoplasma pini]